MQKILLFSVVFLTILCSTQMAQAELITIAITGVVDGFGDNGNYLEGKVHVGDAITGTYTYESTIPDSDPYDDPAVGFYCNYGSPCGVSLTVDGFNFKTDPANTKFLIEIDNNNSGIDGYLIRSYNNLAISNGSPVETISWELQDNTCTAFSSDALPTTAPILSQWQTNSLWFGMSRYYGIGAHVTSATLIPEPATILLFGLGILSLRKRK
jgi:hypothetical protein